MGYGANKKCLDLSGAHLNNGTHLIFWKCHNGWNQKFNIVGFAQIWAHAIRISSRAKATKAVRKVVAKRTKVIAKKITKPVSKKPVKPVPAKGKPAPVKVFVSGLVK